ncbi:hypothetical protein [Mycobacterium sp. 1164966.3]|uniref:hypothetical protein n=1 Tax=Mycobacterium sp. 1164966.3 TaxID=1856861 RepID=UPI0012E91669|nr:hypothetical protein [Mycobacterium sp. 1164966.3]
MNDKVLQPIVTALPRDAAALKICGRAGAGAEGLLVQFRDSAEQLLGGLCAHFSDRLGSNRGHPDRPTCGNAVYRHQIDAKWHQIDASHTL